MNMKSPEAERSLNTNSVDGVVTAQYNTVSNASEHDDVAPEDEVRAEAEEARGSQVARPTVYGAWPLRSSSNSNSGRFSG